LAAYLNFYPEKRSLDFEIEPLLRKLCKCDKRALEVIKATAAALIKTILDERDPEKQP
jgi:hypothetical protein